MLLLGWDTERVNRRRDHWRHSEGWGANSTYMWSRLHSSPIFLLLLLPSSFVSHFPSSPIFLLLPSSFFSHLLSSPIFLLPSLPCFSVLSYMLTCHSADLDISFQLWELPISLWNKNETSWYPSRCMSSLIFICTSTEYTSCYIPLSVLVGGGRHVDLYSANGVSQIRI